MAFRLRGGGRVGNGFAIGPAAFRLGRLRRLVWRTTSTDAAGKYFCFVHGDIRVGDGGSQVIALLPTVSPA